MKKQEKTKAGKGAKATVSGPIKNGLKPSSETLTLKCSKQGRDDALWREHSVVWHKRCYWNLLLCLFIGPNPR